MKKLLLAAAACLLLAGCTDPQGAKEALGAAGYKDIRITGYSLFGCGKDDTYSTAFTATGQNGSPVSGVVCAGLFFKGSTIRTY